MDSIISTFHIDWKIIIAQAVNFWIVFVVLHIYALKPLGKLMKEREEKIQRGINDAKKSDELLQKAAEEYKQNAIKLRHMAIEGQKELSKDLEQLRAENLNRIKADNDEWARKRKEQMEIDKKALVEGAKSELASLAVLAAQKIMEERNKQENM